ncbi:30S ribosome-binding factor RbfA [Hyphococcus lacteus]|uniref:Ribosome-binding factor A n=1 Tax=Hyphococcus lacteus TaxID=3143536 RepID=A0ABV3Z2A4_9PROT
MSKRYSSAKGPSQRQLRAGELLRHALVEVLQREDLREPELSGVSVTVSEIRISPDLKQASAFVAPLGGGNEREMVKALNKVAPYLRSLVGQKITMKYTPAIKFMSDETFAEAKKIDELLSRPEVVRDLETK